MDDTTIFIEPIQYSEKFEDDNYEYRYVTLPESLASLLVPQAFMSEQEWRQLGITMSAGWVHCGCLSSAPHILWFRRPVFQINTPFVARRQDTQPRLTKSANDVPNKKMPPALSSSTVLEMRRLVVPNQEGFKQKKPTIEPFTIDLPPFNLASKQPFAPSRTVTLRNSLQTLELLRL